jgi:thioredoxin family protein
MSSHIVNCNACGTANRIPADKQGKAGRCGNCHAILPALYFQPQQLNERTFDDFIRSCGSPVLAEFWAPW